MYFAAPNPPITAGGTGGSEGPTTPSPLVADSTDVYGLAFSKAGCIEKVATIERATVDVACGQASIVAIAGDTASVYWLTSTALLSVSKGGGTPMTLAAGLSKPQGLTVNATGAYWTTGHGEVMRVPAAGGASVTIATGQSNPYAMASNDVSVYWTTDEANGSIVQFNPGPGCP